jgi:hypothetical protein
MDAIPSPAIRFQRPTPARGGGHNSGFNGFFCVRKAGSAFWISGLERAGFATLSVHSLVKRLATNRREKCGLR